MKPLIIIRPQPGCDTSVEAARAMGLEALGFPLFAVQPVLWEPPSPDTFDALLIGSANALRHGGTGLQGYRGKPVYAVGAATAQAAHDCGLDVMVAGQGGLQAVLSKLAPNHARLLRLCGHERVALALPEGHTMTERVVYASASLPMPAALQAMLGQPAVIALHSAEAARHFAAETTRLGLDRSQTAAVSLGPRITAALGTGWAARLTAENPTDEALLALAGQLCQ